MSDQKNINFNFGFTECPSCQHKMDSMTKTINIPNFGETIIFTLICSNCGYKTSDLFPVQDKEPKRYILAYSNSKQLIHKIIRSSSCIIKIPELGISIEPSQAAEGYITNLEGLLQKIKTITLGLIKILTSEKKINNALALIQKIDTAIDGNFIFTLILEDPKGNSAIIKEFEDESLQEEPF
ncbi:MAG: ZPR1 zinc finger domain-containing protein [Candidatus Lokiarchaeota archaeon]|nr:ZPR1 zinc finger domain-containing protein [Candidatus Lokiarchaeota archaeon]